MYGITIGETLIRVVGKEDARALVGILFDLNCPERVSSKPITNTEKENEDGTERTEE